MLNILKYYIVFLLLLFLSCSQDNCIVEKSEAELTGKILLEMRSPDAEMKKEKIAILLLDGEISVCDEDAKIKPTKNINKVQLLGLGKFDLKALDISDKDKVKVEGRIEYSFLVHHMEDFVFIVDSISRDN